MPDPVAPPQPGPPDLRLIIRRRSGDYHCQIVGDPKIWDCGSTPEEALGRWLITHGADFGVAQVDFVVINPPAPHGS